MITELSNCCDAPLGDYKDFKVLGIFRYCRKCCKFLIWIPGEMYNSGLDLLLEDLYSLMLKEHLS